MRGWWCGSGRRAHYPSGGLETTVTSGRGSVGFHSLPLRGIRNAVPSARTCSSSFSLPLRGIRNLSQRPRPGHPRRLITPQGDQEPTPGPPWYAVSYSSLPLRGIRNAGRGCRPPGDQPAHYPSGGSGTTEARSDLDSVTSHYPSGGSGTCSLPDLFRFGFQLITPHGDQERLAEAEIRLYDARSLPLRGIRNSPEAISSTQLNCVSLPLMGIRNPAVNPPTGILRLLITPHGDQELAIATALACRAWTSLPLMGIRNLLSNPDGPDGYSLITPHGDQERQGRRYLGSHRSHSLPLMGIRNATYRTYTGHSTNASLPLMGIRNTPRPRDFLPVAQLITPQGDQERGQPHPATPPGQPAHYPSGGSGTPWRGPSTTNSNSTHYPSGGSGTRHGLGLLALDRLLITPHGDQEPSDLSWAKPWLLCSLPLMGIRNSLGSHAHRGLPQLITPHGDQEHPDHAPRLNLYSDSLPLMGIRNLHNTRELFLLRQLITPHGDQELQLNLLHNGNVVVSLPLMGIRNPFFQAFFSYR